MQHNQHIAELGILLESRGIRHAIIAPGSRNAPLIQLFTGNKAFISHSIVDERSAGYVALGMARELKEPVVLVTTSGTAVLNLSPAVAEAFHQHIPLVVLTADRPLEKISRFNNQVINQTAPYFNHSRGFLELPFEFRTESELKQAFLSVGQLLDEALVPETGPVHVNIPLLEPLYEPLPSALKQVSVSVNPGTQNVEFPVFDKGLATKKIMLLAGMGNYGKEIEPLLRDLSSRYELLVVAENIANLASGQFVVNPELVLAGSGEAERDQLAPDVLISFGGQVVSKRLRLFLESLQELEHIEIKENIRESLKRMFASGDEGDRIIQNHLQETWKRIESREAQRAVSYIQGAPFSNLSVIHKVLSLVPAHSTVHLGNSSVIRYSQLFPGRDDLSYYSNRGTSGIDGSLSTAVGAAMVSDELHLLLLGDLSFVYDSNALWNKNFPPNLKIVVINDGGGGIFRLLEGPERMEFFEEFSVTHHPVSLELLSQSFGREFRRAVSMDEVTRDAMALFHPDSSLSILEVDTTKSENSRTFKEFFNQNQ
ncbi:MAG: 2-succinyl-5-enolpyruvyl-6-hydroxy-3-cyclohexene-1-carboxylic-acid synthase [Bacteroidota bacterium]